MEKKENLLNQSLDSVMADRFGQYSKYIIQERALPDVRDGLKPVQRRILFSMNDLGLFSNKPFKKSARVVGDVIGKYHPHGDSSIYEALVRMSQSWKMGMQLVQMHGNNGSIDDDPAAAMRYTEARLHKITSLLIKNIKKKTVAFAPNFDDSEIEPTVFPALLPNLLVNGAKGIAAGYATEMPPHNLGEVIDAIIAKVKSPNARLDTLLNYIKGPDFPTGGTVQGTAGIYEAFERGRGKVIVRSKYEISNLKTKPSISITEIPFGVVKSKLVKQIDEIRFNNKIDGIKDVLDETDRNGLSIYIELYPGTDIDAIINYLLAKTEMQIYYNYNNVAIKDKVPTQMGLIQIINAYLKHQKQVQTSALNFDLSANSRRLEIVQGLIKVASISDQVIDTIKNASGSKQGVVEALMKNHQFTELQANAIADLKLYRLSRTDQSVYLTEEKELAAEIARLEKILGSDEEFDKYLIELLKDIKDNYAVPRKTDIKDGEMETINIDMDALIKPDDVWVGISREGYIKRFSNRAYEANTITGYKLKEGDSLKGLQFVNTLDKLLIFTSMGNYFMIPVHKIVESKYKEIGKHINTFATLNPDEQIIKMINVKDFKTNGFIVQATSFGKIKRTPLNSFEVARHTRLYKSIKLKDEDNLVSVQISNGKSQVIIIGSDACAVKYSEIQVPILGTKTAGVKGIKLKDTVVSAMVIANGNNHTLGLISNRGGMKRMKLASILPAAKTTRGRKIYRTLKGMPHKILAAELVTSKTKGLMFKDKIYEFQFNKVDITLDSEGISLIGPKKIFDGTIMKPLEFNPENQLFSSEILVSAEDKFSAAEKTISEVSQLDIDALLKGIK